MINIKHSGNMGDILYSLPAIRKASEIHKQKVHLHLSLNTTGYYSGPHPLGNKLLNEEMARMAKPLFESTEFIEQVSIWDGIQVDYDLDLFRKTGFNFGAGDIMRWVFYAYPELTTETHKPTIKVKPIVGNYIVLNRTARYLNPFIDYSYLKNWVEMIYFVGVESEYQAMQRIIPGLERKVINDFLEYAQLIAGSIVYIGNQSMGFGIAEQMKHPRILEISPKCPNVIPNGGVAYDCFNQQGFMYAINQFLK